MRVVISGYRYYLPEVGRWINRDPIGEMGGKNIYSFAVNNTIRFIDPFGLSGWVRFIGGVRVIGGTVEAVGGLALAGGGGGTEVVSAGLTSPASIPAMIFGTVFYIHGSDTAIAGWKELWSGERTQSYTSKAVEDITGSEYVGELVDAGLGIASVGPTTSVLTKAMIQADGYVVVYRGMSLCEYQALQEACGIAARGGTSAAPTTWGRFWHSMTYANKFPRYKSGYASVTLLPDVAQGFGKGGVTVRMAVPASEALWSFNVPQGELLVRGGTTVKLLGLVEAGEKASNTVRLLNATGSSRYAYEPIRIGLETYLDQQGLGIFQREIGEPEDGDYGAVFVTPVKGNF